MSLRFTTARDLFDAFPPARRDVDAEPNDDPSLDYVRALAGAGQLENALAFCAYLLPRREAVAWGCRCVRVLLPKLSESDEACLKAAEDWVRDPENDVRLAALEIGLNADHNSPTAWLARAAGWSGGNVLLDFDATAAASPQQTAQAVRAALLVTISRLAPASREEGLRSCVDAAVRMASEEVR